MITRDYILNLLQTNDKAVARALVALNARQTENEQVNMSTRNNNGRGFTPADAHMGTSIANFYEKVGRLTEKQIAYWRKPNAKGIPRICKYANQLIEIAEEKAAKPVVVAISHEEDVGNLMEERMVLEEQLEGYLEGAIVDDGAMDRAMSRLMQIKEQLEEIARCEYKMNRDFTLAA